VEDDINWEDVSTTGAQKFLARALRIANEVSSPTDVVWAEGDQALRRVTHRPGPTLPGSSSRRSSTSSSRASWSS
jgi:leucyl-tRNA synthetase